METMLNINGIKFPNEKREIVVVSIFKWFHSSKIAQWNGEQIHLFSNV